MNHVPQRIAPGAASLDTLLATLRARRAEFCAARRMAPDIVQAFREVGVYRALVARRFGGEERAPAAFLRLIECIATADGAAGWVASFGVAATYVAALPLPSLEVFYAEGPDVVFGGGIFPLQPAPRVPGGFRVTGRWPYGSGCTGARWIGAGILPQGEAAGALPRVAVMPAAQVRIEENWDVIGLQGTGSHDTVVEDVFVPEEWTMVRGSRPSVDSPNYRYPNLALAAQVLAVVGLGVARDALDVVTAQALGQGSITGAPRMADRAHVQSGIAAAEASLRAARGFFYDATEQAWTEVLDDGHARPASVALLRLAATHAAREAADVARRCFMLAGTGAIQQGHPLARAMADTQVVAQHAFLGEGTLQSVGASLLGLPAAPGFA